MSKDVTEKPKTFGTVEASNLTGVNYITIRNYVKDGKIDGFVNELNGRVRVTELGVNQLLKGYKGVNHAKIKNKEK